MGWSGLNQNRTPGLLASFCDGRPYLTWERLMVRRVADERLADDDGIWLPLLLLVRLRPGLCCSIDKWIRVEWCWLGQSIMQARAFEEARGNALLLAIDPEEKRTHGQYAPGGSPNCCSSRDDDMRVGQGHPGARVSAGRPCAARSRSRPRPNALSPRSIETNVLTLFRYPTFNQQPIPTGGGKMFVSRSASMARALARPSAVLRRGIAEDAMNKPAYRLVLVRYVRLRLCVVDWAGRWVGWERRPRPGCSSG